MKRNLLFAAVAALALCSAVSTPANARTIWCYDQYQRIERTESVYYLPAGPYYNGMPICTDYDQYNYPDYQYWPWDGYYGRDYYDRGVHRDFGHSNFGHDDGFGRGGHDGGHGSQSHGGDHGHNNGRHH